MKNCNMNELFNSYFLGGGGERGRGKKQKLAMVIVGGNCPIKELGLEL